MPVERYLRAHSLVEALALKSAHRRARYIAGGTALIPRLWRRRESAETLISLCRIPEMRGLVENGGWLTLGALTTLTELERAPWARERFPALAQAAGFVADVRVRNAATLGGHLCAHEQRADGAAPLLAYEARVKLAGPTGQRELSLEEFFAAKGMTTLTEDEILVAVLLPVAPTPVRAVLCRDHPAAPDDAPATLAATAHGDLQRAPRVLLAVARAGVPPRRLRRAEAGCTGAPLSGDAIAHAAHLAAQEAEIAPDPRASESLQRQAVERLARRALESLSLVNTVPVS